MKITDKSEFKDWYKDFIKCRGGLLVNSDKFYDELCFSHEKLMEKIGGSSKSFRIHIENKFIPADIEQIEPLVKNLKEKIDKYFVENNIFVSDMCTPLVNKGKLEGTKWGKHIQHWMKVNKYSLDDIKEVNNIVAKLGSKWANCQTKEEVLYGTLTCDPVAFAKIGNYGPDSGSCFRQSQCNQHHKYILGINPNTYVLLISHNEINNIIKDTNNILVRMWGQSLEIDKKYYVGNRYASSSSIEANVNKATDKVFAEMLGTNKAKKYDDLVVITKVFQNKGSNWTYTLEGNKDSIQVSFTDSFLGKLKKCCKCGCPIDPSVEDESIYTYENKVCCISCTRSLPTCFFTKKKCFSVFPTYDYNNGNTVVSASTEFIIESGYIASSYTNIYSRKEDIVKVQPNLVIHISEIGDFGVAACECGTYISREYWYKIVQKVVCKNCYLKNKGNINDKQCVSAL